MVYIPEYECNIVGSLEGRYGVIIGEEGNGKNMITDVAGCCVAVMDGARIKIVGQVPGSNTIDVDGDVEIRWEKEEREKWMRYVKDQKELESRAASLTICDVGNSTGGEAKINQEFPNDHCDVL